MATKWAKKNGMAVCVYGEQTDFDQMVRQMSQMALSKCIDMPLPFEEHMAEWVSITLKIMDVNAEVVGVD